MSFKHLTIAQFIDNDELDIRTGPFGTQLKASDYVSKGTPVINVRNIGFGNVIEDKLEYISDNTRDRLNCHVLKENDIVFGRKGAVERHSFIDNYHANWFQGSDCIRLRMNTARLHPRFLSYYFLTTEHKNFIKQQCSNGTIMASLNQSIIRQINIPLPDLSEQKVIASTLSCIDDKIELNNRMNKTLEEMAQAIFKSWFIDFEPFQDGEFEDNKFGLIPKGWRVEPIGTLCESISKKHDFQKAKLIFLNTGDIKKGQFLHNTYSDIEGMPGQAKKSIQQNDILFSEIRPINSHFAYVNFNAADYVVSTKLMVIRSKKINSRRLYHYITSPSSLIELQQEAESRSGTFPQIRFENIKNLPMLLATEDIEVEFSMILESIYSIIYKNILENQRLKELRDTLLPKLMSGEIRVPVQED